MDNNARADPVVKEVAAANPADLVVMAAMEGPEDRADHRRVRAEVSRAALRKKTSRT